MFLPALGALVIISSLKKDYQRNSLLSGRYDVAHAVDISLPSYLLLFVPTARRRGGSLSTAEQQMQQKLRVY